MGYYNPVYRYNAEAFAKTPRRRGRCVDRRRFAARGRPGAAAPARQAGLDLVRLATPTSDAHRLPKIVDGASGFLYYVAIAGVTGTCSAEAGAVQEAVTRLRRFTNLPIVVGFGIKTPEQAAEIARVADAAVVASALVDRLARNLDPAGKTLPGLVDAVLRDIAALADGIRGARPETTT
jgi:tryptophan synthase alpha chain